MSLPFFVTLSPTILAFVDVKTSRIPYRLGITRVPAIANGIAVGVRTRV